MNRHQATTFIVHNPEIMSDKDIRKFITDMVECNIEAVPVDGKLLCYALPSHEDSVIKFAKDDVVTITKNFPKRFIEDTEGELEGADGKKYTVLTQENLKDSDTDKMSAKFTPKQTEEEITEDDTATKKK